MSAVLGKVFEELLELLAFRRRDATSLPHVGRPATVQRVRRRSNTMRLERLAPPRGDAIYVVVKAALLLLRLVFIAPLLMTRRL